MAFVFVSFWWDVMFCLGMLLGLLYALVKKNYNYWRLRGLHGPEPSFFIGNLAGVASGKTTLGIRFADLYNLTKDEPCVGVYMMLRPTLLVNGLEQIRNILIRDFSHFTDHSVDFNEKVDPLAAHLFSLKGERWKNLRVKLTPTFTTSKMKMMFKAVDSCGDVMVNYLENNLTEGCDEEMKELMAKFNTDVIGSCAFGIECDSFKNPNSDFRRMGKKVFHLPVSKAVLQFLRFFFPTLMVRAKVKVVEKEVEDFFYNLVKNTIEYREKNNIVRNDFLQLLIDLKNEDTSEDAIGDGTKLTMMQLAAQVFVFFLAGFETSSTTSSFALYELALNPDIQKKLATEIDEVITKHNGELTYVSLGEMTYLTKVIEETLRKYPPLPMIFRICTKEYVLPDTDIKIERDTPVIISAYGIHRDPEIYPNPDKFDPERFSPENKASRDNVAYLPFGEGPRICIGSRFGLMQTKLGLVKLLSKYEVSVCDKTPIPMVYDKKSFILASKGGLYLKIKSRTK